MISKITAVIVNLRKRAIAETAGLWSDKETCIGYERMLRVGWKKR